ncbi:MAG: hypothetical protein QME62_03950 [Armatimonadota bacterium]|nr:hypothetical protein [Armatimonadota bacterium]
MLSSVRGRVLIVALMLIVLVSAFAIFMNKPKFALAQVPPALEEQSAPAAPGGPPFAGDMSMTMMRRNMMGCVAIAVSEKYVYVVMGGTVYQLTADTLKKVRETSLMPAVPVGGSSRVGPPPMAPDNSRNAPGPMGAPNPNR